MTPQAVSSGAARDRVLTRANLGFLLAKASQRWNELLYARFSERGFPDVRPAYGSVLIPLYEEDGLRMGELARRARISKQTMTTLVRLMERERLVERKPDPADGRAYVVWLSRRAREFEAVATRVLAEMQAIVEERLTKSNSASLAASLREVMTL